MATPPFNITETVPGDGDVAANFPAAERTFRDIVEDWITTEHTDYGHHKFPVLTTAARDAITTWGYGSLIYNTSTATLQIQTDADSSPMVWADAVDPGDPIPAFEAGTIMLFMQTAAPTGWTKDVTHNDKALRLVSGTAASGGSSPFSTVFGKLETDAFTLTASHIPAHTHSMAGSFPFSGTTGSGGSHSHTYQTAANDTNRGQEATDAATFNTSNATTSTSGAHTHSFSGNVSLSGSTGSAGSGGGHTHAMDIRVQYADVIAAVKD